MQSSFTKLWVITSFYLFAEMHVHEMMRERTIKTGTTHVQENKTCSPHKGCEKGRESVNRLSKKEHYIFRDAFPMS